MIFRDPLRLPPEKAGYPIPQSFYYQLVKNHSHPHKTGTAFGKLPIEELDEKLETGYEKVAETQQRVDDWWAGLTPPEMNNPVNKAKYQAANAALARAGAVLDAAAVAVENIAQSTVPASKKFNYLNFN